MVMEGNGGGIFLHPPLENWKVAEHGVDLPIQLTAFIGYMQLNDTHDDKTS